MTNNGDEKRTATGNKHKPQIWGASVLVVASPVVEAVAAASTAVEAVAAAAALAAAVAAGEAWVEETFFLHSRLPKIEIKTRNLFKNLIKLLTD